MDPDPDPGGPKTCGSATLHFRVSLSTIGGWLQGRIEGGGRGDGGCGGDGVLKLYGGVSELNGVMLCLASQGGTHFL
jgi:hypothetical protein